MKHIIKKKEYIMRKVLTILAATMFAGAAFAEDTTVSTPVLSGEVSLDFAETANDKWGGTMGLDLGVDAAGLATVDLDFSAVDGGAVTLDNWTVGTEVAGIGIAMGDDNGVMPGAEGEQALAVGFTDWTADITDVSNVQGAYTMGVAGLDVTAAADYNLNTENFVLGAG